MPTGPPEEARYRALSGAPSATAQGWDAAAEELPAKATGEPRVAGVAILELSSSVSRRWTLLLAAASIGAAPSRPPAALPLLVAHRFRRETGEDEIRIKNCLYDFFLSF